MSLELARLLVCKLAGVAGCVLEKLGQAARCAERAEETVHAREQVVRATPDDPLHRPVRG